MFSSSVNSYSTAFAGNAVHHGKTFSFNVIQLGLMNFNFKSALLSSSFFPSSGAGGLSQIPFI